MTIMNLTHVLMSCNACKQRSGDLCEMQITIYVNTDISLQ